MGRRRGCSPRLPFQRELAHATTCGRPLSGAAVLTNRYASCSAQCIFSVLLTGLVCWLKSRKEKRVLWEREQKAKQDKVKADRANAQKDEFDKQREAFLKKQAEDKAAAKAAKESDVVVEVGP